MLYQKYVQLKDQAVFGLCNLGSKFSIIHLLSSAQINHFSKAKEGQLQHSHIRKVGYSCILSKYIYIERVVFLRLTLITSNM